MLWPSRAVLFLWAISTRQVQSMTEQRHTARVLWLQYVSSFYTCLDSIIAPEHAVLVKLAGPEGERSAQRVGATDKKHQAGGVAVDDDAGGLKTQRVLGAVLVKEAQRQGGDARLYLQRAVVVVVEEIVGAGAIDLHAHYSAFAGLVVGGNHLAFEIDILKSFLRLCLSFVAPFRHKHRTPNQIGDDKDHPGDYRDALLLFHLSSNAGRTPCVWR